ncbi:MAG: twin-arginine translocase subunit TatC [Spirochaetia bacterium]|nr:twin-arginine translocase subunit TatC [Spirochaetia bacterium]
MSTAIGEEKDGPSMSFFGHLAELRKRLITALIVFLLVSIASFNWSEKIADFIIAPAKDMAFVFLSPPDLFMLYIKIALSMGLVISLPVIIFELWMFISPALLPREKRSIFFSLLAGGILFILGAAFSYFVIIPFTIRFFMSYQSVYVKPMISISEYFGFVISLALSFGAAFELPVVAGLLGAFGILKAELLIRIRRIAILLIFIAAAILTPPDVVSQVLLALPMLGLYELSVLILKQQEKRRANKEAQAEVTV